MPSAEQLDMFAAVRRAEIALDCAEQCSGSSVDAHLDEAERRARAVLDRCAVLRAERAIEGGRP